MIKEFFIFTFFGFIVISLLDLVMKSEFSLENVLINIKLSIFIVVVFLFLIP